MKNIILFIIFTFISVFSFGNDNIYIPFVPEEKQNYKTINKTSYCFKNVFYKNVFDNLNKSNDFKLDFYANWSEKGLNLYFFIEDDSIKISNGKFQLEKYDSISLIYKDENYSKKIRLNINNKKEYIFNKKSGYTDKRSIDKILYKNHGYKDGKQVKYVLKLTIPADTFINKKIILFVQINDVDQENHFKKDKYYFANENIKETNYLDEDNKKLHMEIIFDYPYHYLS